MSYGNRKLSYQKTQSKQPLTILIQMIVNANLDFKIEFFFYILYKTHLKIFYLKINGALYKILIRFGVKNRVMLV